MSKKIAASIDIEENERASRRAVRARLREEARSAPNKRTIVVGGKRKLHEPVSTVALSDELNGSLRMMKNNANVLKERYYSMLERGKFSVGDKTKLRKMERQMRKKHRPYGKSHWGVDALKAEAKKRAS